MDHKEREVFKCLHFTVNSANLPECLNLLINLNSPSSSSPLLSLLPYRKLLLRLAVADTYIATAFPLLQVAIGIYYILLKL